MVDAEVVISRLAVLRDNLRRLQEIVDRGQEAFVSDEDLYLKAERCLQLALQSMLDIGMHIIASEDLGRPATYEEVVPELGRAGVLSEPLVERLRGSAGLRNILVHDYVRIDHDRLFELLRDGIPDLESFVKQIALLLED